MPGRRPSRRQPQPDLRLSDPRAARRLGLPRVTRFLPEGQLSDTFRDWIASHRIDGLPSSRALEHPFFDLALSEARAMPRRHLIRELRLLPKIGDKSSRIILDALGPA